MPFLYLPLALYNDSAVSLWTLHDNIVVILFFCDYCPWSGHHYTTWSFLLCKMCKNPPEMTYGMLVFYCHNQWLSSLLHRDRLPASPNRCRKQTLAKRCGAHLSGHGLPLNHLPSCPLLIFNWVFWIDDEGPKMFESFSSFWKRRQ